MAGLHVPDKAERVAAYQKKTVHVALEICGALGHSHAGLITGDDVVRRAKGGELRTLSEIYPWITLKPGSLLDGSAPIAMQKIFSGKGGHHDHYAWERL